MKVHTNQAEYTAERRRGMKEKERKKIKIEPINKSNAKELLTIIGLKIMVPRCFRCRGEKKEALRGRRKSAAEKSWCDLATACWCVMIAFCCYCLLGADLALHFRKYSCRDGTADSLTKRPRERNCSTRPAYHAACNFFNNFPFIY